MIKKVLFTALVASALGTAQASDLVVNGGFESGLSGWTSGGGQVDATLVSNYSSCCAIYNSYPYNSGNAAFFGSGNLPGGWISQNLATTAGDSYTLSFLYGAIAASNLQTMNVSVLNGSTVLASTDVSAYGTYNVANMMANNTLNFTATSSSTTLKFADTSLITNNTDGVLGNVSIPVAAVPEPETYAMMLAGLGLMGFMVHRKKTA